MNEQTQQAQATQQPHDVIGQMLDSLQGGGSSADDVNLDDLALAEGEDSTEDSSNSSQEATPQEVDDADIATLLAGEEQNAQLLAMQQEITQLKQQLAARPTEPAKPVEYVNETEFDELLGDRVKFNEKLNAVAAQAAHQAMQQTTQLLSQKFAIQQMASDFYANNPDLNAHRDTVRAVSEKLIRQNPALTYAQLLEKAAKVTRLLKKLPNTAGKRPGTTLRGVPSLPRAGARAGNPNNQQQLSRHEAEIDAMLKVVG